MLVASLAKSLRKDVGRVLLDENVALEGEPRRHLFVAIRERTFHSLTVRRALHHVSMCVTRVTIGAAKRTPDVWIDRPESHTRRFGTVENALRGRRVIQNVLLF